ncbi:hypothetical protein [Yoonia sp. 2307UL14-13]|uniref:hypothetical protein n=1 Tax=Yoonia sp. 2307UL14-13 TaxID=3126506 RepID=UPI0030B69FAD
MIHRARRHGGEALDDLEQLVAINVRRLTGITEVAGLWIVGFVTFLLSGLVMAGFYYGFELAQGMFCLALPLTLTGYLSFRLSRRFSDGQPTGEQLTTALLRTRFWFQMIAVVSIFFTAMYGMYHILSLPVGF